MADEVITVSGDDINVSISDGLEIVESTDLDVSTPAKQAAFRAAIGIGAHPDGTLTTQEVTALIERLIKIYARAGQRSISKDDIDAVFLEELQNGVEFESVQASADALEFTSIGGRAKTIFKRALALGTVTQEAAEAGTSDDPATYTPERIKQALYALGIPRVASLPLASPLERVVFNTTTDTLYRAAAVTGSQTITLTQGEDDRPTEDDTGFDRGNYGSIDPDALWFSRLIWDDADNNLHYLIRSFVDPGDQTVVIPGQGTYQFVGTFDADAALWTGTSAAPINPLTSGDHELTVTSTNPIHWWRAVSSSAAAATGGQRGEQGPRGEQGEQGPQGERGEQGAPGEKGATGDKGETGDKGADGDKGERGDPGPDGQPGSGGGSGVATEIDPVSPLPSATGKEAGTRAISSADDRWKVVVASTDSPNVMRFVLGDFGDGYLGVSKGVTGRPDVGSFEDDGVVGEIKLRTTAANNLPIWEIYRLKSLSANTALANLYGQAEVVRGATKGNVADLATTHSGANDVTNSFNYRSGADDAELDTPAVGDVLQITFFNNPTRTLPATMHGATERWEDEEDHTGAVQVKSDWDATTGDAEILNKPSIPSVGAAFLDGALTGAGAAHMQLIIDAILSAGWNNAAGAGSMAATHPYVREQTRATQFTPSTIVAGSYGALYTNGSSARIGAYVGVRIPKVFDTALKLLRLAINNASNWQLNGANVALITSSATYNYYGVGPVDIPAGADWRIQELDPAEIDNDIIENVPPAQGTDGQQIERVDGKPAWVDKPHRVGRVLYTSSSTFNFALGTNRSIRQASPDYFANFDLTATENQTGVYHILVGLRLGGSGLTDVNMGFLEGGANQSAADRQRELIGEETATRLRGTPVFVYSATEALDGLEAVTQTVWSGSTNVGTYIGLLVRRDTPNMRAGWYSYWVGRSGATTPLMFEDVSLIWVPNDAAAAGTAPRSFLLSARPTTTVSVTTDVPGATAGWTAWTEIESVSAITAEMAGRVVVAADFEANVVTAARGGGDRIVTQLRLMRTRSSADTVLISETLYGPRNLPVGGGTAAVFAEASRTAGASVIWHDTAQTGDVYKLEARCSAQLTEAGQPGREINFGTDNNGLMVFPA